MNKAEKQKIEHVIDLLKFSLASDDREITDTVLRSIIDILEEEITKS